MNNIPSQHDIQNIFFDYAPPHLPDRGSVQAIGADPAGPILTIYRRRPLNTEDWIAGAAKTKRFETYLRRRGSGRWELYNVHGELTDRGDTLPANQPVDSGTAIPVDRAAFLREARELTGDSGISLIACREGHKGASAADHSNFNVTCRRMIGDAGAEDLEQVVIVDSRKWPCPVTGVFANVAKLSPATQDIFLDRLKWLQNSWPLVWGEFHEVLADRLARLRQDHFCELLRDCGRTARMTEDRVTAMVAKWMLASSGPKYRLALHLVETLREGLIFEKGMAETFHPDIVQSRGADVVKDYKKHLTLS